MCHCIYLNFLKSHNLITILEKLSMETLANLNDNNTFAETEKKIRDFFTEDSIIERTGDCKTYFDKYISAKALEKRNVSTPTNLVTF